MDPAASEVPHQPGVHGPEGQFTALGPFSRPGHMVEQPHQLRGAEVRRSPGRSFGGSSARARGAGTHRTSARCDDPARRLLDRPPGRPIPHQRGFALVGDPDGRDFDRRRAGLFEHVLGNLPLRGPAASGSCSPIRREDLWAPFLRRRTRHQSGRRAWRGNSWCLDRGRGCISWDSPGVPYGRGTGGWPSPRGERVDSTYVAPHRRRP